jgi:PAS domain S-box-containing protein
MGVFRNVTKLRETQQILRDNLKFQETIFDTIPNPIYYKDVKGIYQNCNNEFAEKIIGLPKSEILGKTLFDMDVPEELAEKYHKKDFELINNPGKQIYEGKAKCSDGEFRTFIFYKSTVYSSADKPIGIVGIMLDITEIKNMNQQLVNASALTAVGQLATGVAHEFNNILTIISGKAQMAKLQPDDLEEHLKTFQLIYEQTNRGKDIVSNLMLFAKPQEPKIQLNDLSYCIDNVIGLQKKQLALYNIEIIKDFNNLPLLYIDINQMQQVFLNLLINSIHALKPKGNGIIKITGKQKNNCIQISFYDTGIGIKDEHKNKIFNPFFTTKGAAAKDDLQIKGTGLGLSISHKIITNHEGKIYVNSK